jgi:catechol 2,3-dioxygenase-like lactoylglutathione lyase family enzyme
MPPRIKHIAIFAKDQLKMVEFYKTTFGMEQVHQHDSEGDKTRQAYYLSDGHINLAILPAGDREEGIDHFGFEIEDYDATARAALAAGATKGPEEVPQDGRFAEGFIRDPTGTRVDLSVRGWLTKAVG